MLACTRCDDYDCVGLHPPADDENDDEVAPADFTCPTCSVRVLSAAIAEQ